MLRYYLSSFTFGVFGKRRGVARLQSSCCFCGTPNHHRSKQHLHHHHKEPTLSLSYRRSFSSSYSSSSSSNNQDPQQVNEDHKYCVNLVMERDREGYLCGLLVPSEVRKSYFALRAFNVELASIKDGHNARRRHQQQQTTTAAGAGGAIMDTPTSLALQMRMQWWRDALNEIYEQTRTTDDDDDKNKKNAASSASKQQKKNRTGLALNLSISAWHNPVVRSLAMAISQQQESNLLLTRRFLERLVDAREADLELRQHGTMEDAIQYAEDSVASLLYLTLECTGVREDAADEVALHAGIAIGLLTALRATPFRLQHGEVPLPASLFPPDFPYSELVQLSYNNNNNEIAWTDTNAQIWKDAVRHMAQVATNHLVQAQERQSQVPRQGKSALLPLVPAMHYLDQLQKSNYNVFDPVLNDHHHPKSNRLRLLLLLGRSWLTGVY